MQEPSFVGDQIRHFLGPRDGHTARIRGLLALCIPHRPVEIELPDAVDLGPKHFFLYKTLLDHYWDLGNFTARRNDNTTTDPVPKYLRVNRFLTKARTWEIPDYLDQLAVRRTEIKFREEIHRRSINIHPCAPQHGIRLWKYDLTVEGSTLYKCVPRKIRKRQFLTLFGKKLDTRLVYYRPDHETCAFREYGKFQKSTLTEIHPQKTILRGATGKSTSVHADGKRMPTLECRFGEVEVHHIGIMGRKHDCYVFPTEKERKELQLRWSEPEIQFVTETQQDYVTKFTLEVKRDKERKWRYVTTLAGNQNRLVEKIHPLFISSKVSAIRIRPIECIGTPSFQMRFYGSKTKDNRNKDRTTLPPAETVSYYVEKPSPLRYYSSQKFIGHFPFGWERQVRAKYNGMKRKEFRSTMLSVGKLVQNNEYLCPEEIE